MCRHETASSVLRLVLYANLYWSLGRDVKEPISLNTSDSRTLRGTGLHAIGRNFGEAGSGVILQVANVVKDLGGLMDNCAEHL